MNKKNILITGSAGFVGSHLVDHILINTDWNIVGLDSFKHRGDSLRLEGKNPERYKIYTHDLTTPISDRLINRIGEIDYIINMASESHVDRSIIDPVTFCENNFKLVLTMLEYARKIKPKVFIQISTDEVYGAALNGHNHKEWEIHLPSNPYSGSKSAQESMCISYWRTYNVPIIITNTMNMVGEAQDTEKFLPMLIKKIDNLQEVTIHGNENYIGSRFYLHARNHADALIYIIKNTTTTLYEDCMDKIIMPDKYNIVGEKEINNLELASMVAEILGKPLIYRLEDFHKQRPGHDRRYALDGTKLANLGWKAPISFENTLKRVIAWTLKNPEWLK